MHLPGLCGLPVRQGCDSSSLAHSPGRRSHFVGTSCGSAGKPFASEAEPLAHSLPVPCPAGAREHLAALCGGRAWASAKSPRGQPQGSMFCPVQVRGTSPRDPRAVTMTVADTRGQMWTQSLAPLGSALTVAQPEEQRVPMAPGSGLAEDRGPVPGDLCTLCCPGLGGSF